MMVMHGRSMRIGRTPRPTNSQSHCVKYWETNVRAEFDSVDPSHNRLVSQAKRLKFEFYWMGKTAVAALQAKTLLQEQEEFWLLKPNTKERKHFKNALILGNENKMDRPRRLSDGHR